MNKVWKIIKDKITIILTTAVITSLVTASLVVRSKLYFIWHTDHYYEMIFEKFRSMQDNNDGDQLFVVMENEISGEVKFIVDILENTEGDKWAYIYDLWIFYPVQEDQHGRQYINMEHEGNKYLFKRR